MKATGFSNFSLLFALQIEKSCEYVIRFSGEGISMSYASINYFSSFKRVLNP